MSDKPIQKRRRVAASCCACRAARQKCVLPRSDIGQSVTIDRSGSVRSAADACFRCQAHRQPCTFFYSGTVQVAVDDRCHAKTVSVATKAPLQRAAAKSKGGASTQNKESQSSLVDNSGILHPSELLTSVPKRSTGPARNAVAASASSSHQAIRTATKTWFERLLDMFQLYSAFGQSVQQLALDQERKASREPLVSATLRDLLARNDFTHDDEKRINGAASLVDDLPPLSRLHVDKPGDQLLIAVLLVIFEVRPELAQWTSQRVTQTMTFGVQSVHEAIALQLVGRNVLRFFPRPTAFTPLHGRTFFDAAARGLERQRGAGHDCCTHLTALAIHDTLSILAEDVGDEPTVRPRCTLCGRGSARQVRPMAHDDPWESILDELRESSAVKTSLMRARFACMDKIRDACRAYAQTWQSMKKEDLAAREPDEVCAQGRRAMTLASEQIKRMEDAFEIVIRDHFSSFPSSEFKSLRMEIHCVHYAALSQIIKTTLIPFSTHVSLPDCSVAFFTALHANPSYLDFLVLVGEKRMAVARSLCTEFIATERSCRSGKKIASVLQTFRPTKQDRRCSDEDIKDEYAHLRPNAFMLGVCLSSATKALCEGISGRWFAGHLPSDGEEWASWQTSLTTIEAVSTALRSMINEADDPNHTSALHQHPLYTTYRIVRQTAFTVETWIEAAYEQAITSTFRRVLPSTLPGKTVGATPVIGEGMDSVPSYPGTWHASSVHSHSFLLSAHDASSSDSSVNLLFDILNTPIEQFFVP